MPTPTTVTEYAQSLIERFKSMTTAVGEANLRQIFLGAKIAIPIWLDAEERKVMIEAYKIAEKELFPEETDREQEDREPGNKGTRDQAEDQT